MSNIDRLQELIDRFDREYACDCPDNRDRHTLAECPNRKPLSIWSDLPRRPRNFCRTFDHGGED